MFDHIGFGAGSYAAFVIGPDGHNVEAVCHNPGARAPVRYVGMTPKVAPWSGQ